MWRVSLSVAGTYFTSVFWIDVVLWKLEFLNIKGSCNPETFLRDFHTMQKWFSCCCTNVHFNGFNGFKRGSKGGIQNLHLKIRLLCFEMPELWMCGSISKLVLPGLSKEASLCNSCYAPLNILFATPSNQTRYQREKSQMRIWNNLEYNSDTKKYRKQKIFIIHENDKNQAAVKIKVFSIGAQERHKSL